MMYAFSCLQTLNLDYNGALWFVKKKRKKVLDHFLYKTLTGRPFMQEKSGSVLYSNDVAVDLGDHPHDLHVHVCSCNENIFIFYFLRIVYNCSMTSELFKYTAISCHPRKCFQKRRTCVQEYGAKPSHFMFFCDGPRKSCLSLSSPHGCVRFYAAFQLSEIFCNINELLQI